MRFPGYIGRFGTPSHALGDKPGKSGPKRMVGCWACAYFGHVASGEPDIKPWYGKTTPEFWQACGFEHMPAYKTVQKRHSSRWSRSRTSFAEALQRLVKHVRKREPRIGHAICVDATMSESNARLHRLTNPDGKVPKRMGKLPVIAAERMPTELVDDIRRAANTAPPDAGLLQVDEYVDVTAETRIPAPLAATGSIRLKSGDYSASIPTRACAPSSGKASY